MSPCIGGMFANTICGTSINSDNKGQWKCAKEIYGLNLTSIHELKEKFQQIRTQGIPPDS